MLTNLPNILTFSRIVAIPVLIVLLLFVDDPAGSWLAFSTYTYACVTDFFDGYLARAWHQQSALGRFLDPIADKLLVVSVLLVLVGIDRISGLTVLPAAVILCREILVSGLREYLAGIRISVPVSQFAKWKTTIQMFAIGFLMVGEAGRENFPTVLIGDAGLWIAAALTLMTGYDYLRAGLRHIEAEDSAESPNQVSGAE